MTGHKHISGNPSDDAVFTDIVRIYNEPLTAFVNHIVKDLGAAEDIVQDLLLGLWMSRNKVDLNMPVRNYLYITARNHAVSYLRKHRRVDNTLPAALPTDEQTVLFMIEEESRRLLHTAIMELPSRTAQVIRLSLEGLPQGEIAAVMGVSLANVKALKSIGIKKLREILGPMSVLLVMISFIHVYGECGK